MTVVDEEWTQLKEVIVEREEHTEGYQRKLDNRTWFDEGCKTVADEKNVAFKNGLIYRPHPEDWNKTDSENSR